MYGLRSRLRTPLLERGRGRRRRPRRQSQPGARHGESTSRSGSARQGHDGRRDARPHRQRPRRSPTGPAGGGRVSTDPGFSVTQARRPRRPRARLDRPRAGPPPLQHRQIAAVAGRGQHQGATSAAAVAARRRAAETRPRSARRRAAGPPRARQRDPAPRRRASISASGLPVVAPRSRLAAARARPRSNVAASPLVSPGPPASPADRLRRETRDHPRERRSGRRSDRPPAGGRQQQRLRARAIQPVGIVNEDRNGLLLGIGGQQAERGRTDREPLLSRTAPQRERAFEGDR